MFRIKICGITSVEDACAAIHAGADAIGLNFYEKSPRCVEPEMANKIASGIPLSAIPVGLFVNHSAEGIRAICKQVGLHVIQLHGDEPPEFLGQLNRNYDIIRARRVSEKGLEEIKEDLQACSDLSGFCPDTILLDAESPGEYGGTGKTISWTGLSDHHDQLGVPLILAGGLTPENVAEAIHTVRPHGVDVASGVESSPGVKDRAKMQAFVEAAQTALAEIRSP